MISKEVKKEILLTQKNNKFDKHNYKLDSSDIADIMAEYLLDRSTKNVERIGKKYNISRQRIYQIVKKDENKKLLDESIKKNRKNFTKKCDVIINKALKRLNNELDNPNSEININQLTTALGILYDKSRLEDGLSTANQELHINIKIDN